MYFLLIWLYCSKMWHLTLWLSCFCIRNTFKVFKIVRNVVACLDNGKGFSVNNIFFLLWQWEWHLYWLPSTCSCPGTQRWAGVCVTWLPDWVFVTPDSCWPGTNSHTHTQTLQSCYVTSSPSQALLQSQNAKTFAS